MDLAARILAAALVAGSALTPASCSRPRSDARSSLPAAPVAPPASPSTSARAAASGVADGGGGGPPSGAPAALVHGCREASFDDPPASDPDADWRTRPGARQYDLRSAKPFERARRFPAGRLGAPALDSAARSAMTAFCTAREQAFFANAREDVREGRSAQDFANECTCQAYLVTPALVSVGCANQTSLGGAHPSWRYAGFTFALASGRAKPITFADVCTPRTECTRRFTELFRDMPNGPPSYDERALADYLGRPTFVLGPTFVRVLIEEELTGYALHGLSCDLAYAELGSLSALRPPLAVAPRGSE